MEVNNYHRCTTQATKSNLAVLSDPESDLHRIPSNVNEKLGFYKSELTEAAAPVGKEVAWSFMERVLAAHTVTCAAKDLDGIVMEGSSDNTKHKSQLSSKDVVKWLPDTRTEIEHIWSSLSVVTKADIKVTVESCLTK